MKIRSITCFVNPKWPLERSILARAGQLASEARQVYEAAGYEVQSIRLATVPFSLLLSDLHAAVELAQALESAGSSFGFEYISIGPALADVPHSYAAVPAILAATQSVFVTGMMTANGGMVLPAAVRHCAEIIHAAAAISPDGFTNLRFAALANVSAGTPFLPGAYHLGDRPAFAIATEAADLALEAVQGAVDLDQAAHTLRTNVENHAAEMTAIAYRLAERYRFDFVGVDFTLAPFPKKAISVGAAVEALGVSAVGRHGSLAAAAFLTDALDRAEFHRAGFGGVFYPVLEDAVLAERAAQGVLGIKDLLLYACVCGTGLDCVPLPGDTSVEQIYPVLLDLAALSQRLDKPLTARLMPIPGKQAGDAIGFDFDFFAAGSVMTLDSSPMEGLLCGPAGFALQPRPQR